MKTVNDNRLPYAPPRCEVMEIEAEQIMVMSGWGPDSDDSEFGPYYGNATQRRGTWGNLWEE